MILYVLPEKSEVEGGEKNSKSGKNSRTTQLEPEGATAQRNFAASSIAFVAAQFLTSFSVRQKGGFSTTRADGTLCFFLTGREGA